MKNRWKCEKGHTMWKKDTQRASQSSNFGHIQHILDHWAFWIIFHQILELNIELNNFWAQFNGWLNNQNVSDRANVQRSLLAPLYNVYRRFQRRKSQSTFATSCLCSKWVECYTNVQTNFKCFATKPECSACSDSLLSVPTNQMFCCLRSSEWVNECVWVLHECPN